MKITNKILTTIFLVSGFFGVAQNVNIPDAKFKSFLVSQSNVNTNNDSVISVKEAAAFTIGFFGGSGSGGAPAITGQILDLTGIEAFVNITRLDVKNTFITNLDVSKNTKLNRLNCDNNSLKNLNLGALNQLTFLDCSFNQLESLDVTKNTALIQLNCDKNQVLKLDLTKNIKLERLFCESNVLSVLDLSNNINLTRLDCGYNQLVSIDITKNTALQSIDCPENQLNSIDVSKNINLFAFICSSNQITSLELSNLKNLILMDCSNNKLTSLDISKNINLGNGSFPGTNDLRGNNLNCICVNSIDDMINRNVFKDSNAVWVEDCSLPCIPPTVTIDNVNFCPGDKDAVLTARSSSAISYKWNFGQSTSSIFINSVGSYSVTVTDSIGLTGTASIEVACNSNGINDFTSSKQFKIYPNPAETTISIGEGNSCKIFSLLGELLITSNFSNVNVENLTTGIYQVIITNNKNQTFSQKLIKE